MRECHCAGYEFIYTYVSCVHEYVVANHTLFGKVSLDIPFTFPSEL